MPECDVQNAVYVKPPALLEQFKLVKSGTFWKLIRAVYGLRVSPRLWGKERDARFRELRFLVGNLILRLMQSSIDVALWTVVEDTEEEWDHNRTPYGFVLTYVDDFLVVGPRDVRNAIEEEISKIWQIKVTGDINQFDPDNFDASLTFLSTTIRSHPTHGGFSMTQEEFTRDVLKTWEMSDCRPVVTPGEPITTELPVEGTPEELDPEDVLRAQKMAGSVSEYT